MNIKQEDFDKLKQLDRIEYRQKEDKIRKKYDSNCLPIALGISFSIMIIVLLIIIFICMVEGIKTVQSEAIIFIGTIVFLMFYSSCSFIIDMVMTFIGYQRLKELEEEYFKLEIKK